MTGRSGRKVAKATKKKRAKKAAGGAKPAARARAGKRPKSADAGSVVLLSRPGIKSIVELKDQLTVANEADKKVVVDASKVEWIDAAALQLLAAFANALREQSRTLEWKAPSTEFCDAVELADLAPVLGIGDDRAADSDDGLCPVF